MINRGDTVNVVCQFPEICLSFVGRILSGVSLLKKILDFVYSYRKNECIITRTNFWPSARRLSKNGRKAARHWMTEDEKGKEDDDKKT
ncbi:hypothetical protein BAU14_09715 [Enterococcus sp. CU9D]|nr:hypothetical protein BAU14_09715 [Enterococcus sp. CU9D]